MIKKLTIIFLCFYSLFSFAQDKTYWYEQQIKSMNLDQKIGQLFMVAAYSNKEASHTAEIENLILNYHIGGLIFFQNDALKQAYLTNYYQSLSKTPMMIGIDGEWGLAMRLQNTQKFPYAITLGALNSDSLVFQIAAAQARQFKRIGIHINFAPVVDINNNPKNPIIGFRSFGDNKYRVARLASAFSNGLMSENILSCAKHFPGHGDVHTDSHLDMPIVNKSKKELDSLELYPFQYLIKNGVPSVMVAHIQYPQLERYSKKPSSLSKYTIDTLLKQEMGFNGLVFTDALNMKGASKNFAPGYIDLEAYKAGNDILLFSENVPLAHQIIKKQILSVKLSEKDLDAKVLKILKWNEYVGLSQYQAIDLKNLENDLKGDENLELFKQVANNTVSKVNDPLKILPLTKTSKVIALTIGDNIPNSYTKKLSENNVTSIQLSKNASAKVIQNVQKKITVGTTVIVSIHQPKVWNQQTAGISQSEYNLINQLQLKHKVIVIGFCSPYALQNIKKNAAIVAAYEDSEAFHFAAINLIYNQIKEKGTVPVKLQFGQITTTPKFPSFNPNADGIDTTMLLPIDDIANQLLKNKAAPGCRILVTKNNKIYYDKCFGYLTYENKAKVEPNTVYDIASVTKVASTTISVMKLFDEGKLSINKKLGDYLPETIGTNKQNLIIKDVLMHQAGLTAWIPFYKATLPNFDHCYTQKIDSNHTVLICDDMYELNGLKDSVYKEILESELESKTYRYSDLGMILMQKVVETISKKPLDVFVYDEFYSPMNLSRITYLPLANGLNKTEIAPTQNDVIFRRQIIKGHVHDPAAAMLGGISGHAGLFSDAYSLAYIMEMLNNKGVYKGKRYLKEATVIEFTKYHSKNSRRGLGFDKPDFSGKSSPASTIGSDLMFGHTGFTGTCVWADPKHNLVYVFLSNRTFPNEENRELISGNYRTRIQDQVYKAIGLK